MFLIRCIGTLLLLRSVSDALHCITCYHLKSASSVNISFGNYIDEDCKNPGTSNKKSVDCDDSYNRFYAVWGDASPDEKQEWEDYYAALGWDRTVCTVDHYTSVHYMNGIYTTIDVYYRGCRKVDENTRLGCTNDFSADEREVEEDLGGVAQIVGEECMCDTDNCNAGDGDNWYREDYGKNAVSVITVSVWIKLFQVGLLLMISG